MTPDGQTGQPALPTASARRKVEICNKKGLHARAAERFVKTAYGFDAEIWVRKNGTTAPGREILELLLLAAPKGTIIEIIATGSDAGPAVETLSRLVECKFNLNED
jgi:phosphocarrier protein HPr